MIITYMSGGLGNQLFNYAAARTLADRHGVELVIDASSYADQWDCDAQRPFVISEFPIRARIRHMGNAPHKPNLAIRLQRRIKEDLFADIFDRTVSGSNSTPWWYYDRKFESLSRRVIMKGWFINPQYFRNNISSIRSDLQAPYESIISRSNFACEIYRKISSETNSVSIHVRRGDLLSSMYEKDYIPDIQKYYCNSIDYFLNRYDRVKFWIFSDDMMWCRELFSDFGGSINFVERKSYLASSVLEDFVLMSRCDHQIIANSTFSWWAAWLNPNDKKTVLAPYRWSRIAKVPMDELMPADWRMIQW